MCRCFDCQGFGMKSCPKCGKGGLTPEQRGERQNYTIGFPYTR